MRKQKLNFENIDPSVQGIPTDQQMFVQGDFKGYVVRYVTLELST